MSDEAGFWSRKSPVQKGPDEPLATHVVSDAVGSWRGSVYRGRSEWVLHTVVPWPFARLSVGHSGIVLDLTLGRYDIPRESIRALRVMPGLVQIIHDVPGYEDYLVFRRVSVKGIVAVLRDLEFPIED